jgi:hypothetical protein
VQASANFAEMMRCFGQEVHAVRSKRVYDGLRSAREVGFHVRGTCLKRGLVNTYRAKVKSSEVPVSPLSAVADVVPPVPPIIRH